MKRFILLLLSIWQQRFKLYLAFAIAGALFGIFILDPINDFVYFHEHGVDEPSVSKYIIEELKLSLQGKTPEKTLFYAQVGVVIGLVIAWIYGFIHRHIQHIEQLSNEIDKDLPGTIRKGEGPLLEFKSSFRWDIEQSRVNRALEGVVMKAIAGFMNSRDGGTLLIGVADDGKILGLGNDFQSLKRKDQDGFEQAIMTAISSAFGTDLCRNIKILFHSSDGKYVCRLIILPASRPVFFKQGNEPKFYLRTGGGTRDLNIQEATEFIFERWFK